jgi:hypothetical protein
MDAYTRPKPHWSHGIALVWWVLVAAPGPALAAKPVLHPATERYRESAPPATGRSGSATLTARALLGKDGATTVEVSTSTLDTATLAPGNIAKLQIKLLDSQGKVRATENHANLSSGGRLQRVLPGLGRGQPLQLQANIEGIDGARMDVVTVRTAVRLLPDLAVEQLSAPASAQVGMPVNISALIAERNGDTGAEADCVLKVDGVEVDRAPGIWVDAASAVTCAFTHTFTSGGMRVLTVEAVDVVPTDDDLSNNQATASLEVISWLRFHHSAYVDSSMWRSINLTEGGYLQLNSVQIVRSEWSNRQEQSNWQQKVELRGELPYAMSFPIPAFELTHSSGGIAIPGTAFYELQADSVTQTTTPAGTFVNRCAWEVDPLTAANLTLCTRTGPGTAQTHFTYSRHGGEVTYFSRWYQATWVTDLRTGKTNVSEWSSNSGSATPTGAARWTPGATYDFDVRLIDTVRRYRATPSVALQAYQTDSSQPYTCTQNKGPSSSSWTCRSLDRTTRGARGTFISTDP